MARLVSPSELGAEGVVTRTGAHRFVQKLDEATTSSRSPPGRRSHSPGLSHTVGSGRRAVRS
jgi:hypothetical protein